MTHRSVLCSTCAALLVIAGVATAHAQFNPLNAQWGKLDPSHVRVVTWNIEDGVSSQNVKQNVVNDWNAIVRVLAVLQPDILVLQEAGDNNGNGQSGGLDSVATLQTTIGLLLRGGADPFRGGNVTSYVQLFTGPGYDLPYVYVSEANDGFNRNVILSRWPFADLNGDGIATYRDMYFVLAPYTLGNGGIRGFQFAEIDLPDDQYRGDLVVGNGHLKSGGGTGDENQRTTAGKNVGYYIEQFYNGAGTGMVDPDDTVSDIPPATRVLDAYTPVIACGDWNQPIGAPLLNPSNLKSPASWLTEGVNADVNGPATDGSDRDGSDMAVDPAKRIIIDYLNRVFEGSPVTNSVGKIDYICYQDSIIPVANSFVYDPFEHNGIYPPPVASYPGQPFNIVKDAADHWPVTVDFIFAAAVNCPEDFDGDGTVGLGDLGFLFACYNTPCGDLDGDGTTGLGDLGALFSAYGPCP